MSHLGDLIVEHGPFTQDLLVGPGFAGPLRWLRSADLNELRDELMRLRADRSRFSLPMLTLDDHGAYLACDRCHWVHELQDGETLTELNQRADEHTEVCQ